MKLSLIVILLKFCKYHHYIFLNSENKETDDKKDVDPENESDNVRVVFLLDKIKSENDGKKEGESDKKENAENIIDKSKGNQKIINLMNQKSFSSIVDSKEYNDLIKKEINKYLEITKKQEEDPKLKSVIEQMKF